MKSCSFKIVLSAVSLLVAQIATATENPLQTFSNAKLQYQRAVADLNGDGRSEMIMVADGPDSNGSIWGELFLYVLDYRGNVIPGWPRSLNSSSVTAMQPQAPAVGDIDGDGVPEIIVSTKASIFGYSSRLFAFRADGSQLPGWPIQITDSIPFMTDPVLSDLDGDGDYEIVVVHGTGLHAFQENGTELSGFPVALPVGFGAIPVIGNVDTDAAKEIVVENRSSGRIYIVSSTGLIKNSLSVTDSTAASHLALINLDSDAALEILHVSNPSPGFPSLIAAYQADGTSVPGWPFTDGLRIFGPPSLGDITGDGTPEICISAVGYGTGAHSFIYALNRQGAPLANFPAPAPIYDANPASVLIGDVSGDGIGDLVFATFVTTPISHVAAFALNGQGNLISSFHIEYNLGSTWDLSPTMADLDGNGRSDLVHNLGSGFLNGYLYAKRLGTSFGVNSHPWPRALGNNQNNAVARN